MVQKLCRLCFEEKLNPITIFTARAIKLKIASTIRMHFRYELNEDDILPKYVCPECWKNVKDFHAFYYQVDSARINYLKNFVKAEVSADFNCGNNVALVLVKVEPLELNVTPNTVQAEFDKNDEDHLETDAIVNENNNDVWNDGIISDFSDECGFERDPELEAATAEIAMEIAKKTENEFREKRKAAVNKKFDHLMSTHMSTNCEVCDEPFESLTQAISHYRNKHNQRSVTLKCCERQLSLRDMRQHIQFHLNPDVFKCSECNKRFKVVRKLNQHMQIHGARKFQCDICKKIFTARHRIRAHILNVHANSHDETVHECHSCKKCFPKKSSLQTHVKNMHETFDRRVMCHICAKVYCSVSSLKSHMQDHSGIVQPRITCQTCGNSFKNHICLSKHMNKHRDEGKSFMCPQCPKISPSRNALARHIRSVHNYTSHECHLCDKVFKRAVALMEHVATHTGQYLYNCVYCPRTFKSNSNMYKHFRGSHPLEWSVDRKSKPSDNLKNGNTK